MSIVVTRRVVEHATVKNGAFVALLALADFANDKGICWPNIDTLAKWTRLTGRQIETVLNTLEQCGEIVRLRGGGRGVSNHYAVLTGLSKNDQETLKIFLGNYFTEIKTVKSTAENPEVSCIETLKFLHEKNGQFEALQSTETAQGEGGNHHGNHHEPPPPPTPRAESTEGGGGGEAIQTSEPELPQTLTAAGEKTKSAGPGRNTPAVTETERWLTLEGMGVAANWGHLPLDAVQADVKRRRGGGQGWGAINNAWKVAPPGTAPPTPIPKRVETEEQREARVKAEICNGSYNYRG